MIKNIPICYSAAMINCPKVLVTGASGFIGSHLIKQLLIQGRWRVRGTLRGAITPERRKEICQALLPTHDQSADHHDHAHLLEFAEVDLNIQEGWKEAVDGCRYVFHVASPTNFYISDAAKLVTPAINGTVNVLNACLESDTVKRVVLTGSSASIAYSDDSCCHNEDDWTVPDNTTPAYIKGKIEAERVAWNFLTKQSSMMGNNFEMAVVNPGLVVGPHILPVKNTGSFHLIKSILNRELPLIPDLPFSLIHVHDVVSAHIAAAEIEEASGHRHIVTDKCLSLMEIANIIKNEFEVQEGYRCHFFSRKLPKSIVWLSKMMGSNDANILYPIIGKRISFDNHRMRNILKVSPTRDVTEGIIESCYSLLKTDLASLPSKKVIYLN